MKNLFLFSDDFLLEVTEVPSGEKSLMSPLWIAPRKVERSINVLLDPSKYQQRSIKEIREILKDFVADLPPDFFEADPKFRDVNHLVFEEIVQRTLREKSRRDLRFFLGKSRV